MAEIRRVFRLFAAWNDTKECRWLSREAARGWRLRSTGFGTYTFEAAKSESVVYEMDFRILSRNEGDEYFTLFTDAGWQHVCSFGNWHYFRAPAETAERIPVFSDLESRKAKLLRVLAVLVISIVPMLHFGIINPILQGYFAESRVYCGIGAASLLIIGVMLYAIVRIVLRIGVLKRRRGSAGG